MREHDVVVTYSNAHHTLVLAIECRDRSRKVTVNDVEGFWSKCQDTGVNKGIVVSAKGFSKSALAKARTKGIDCLHLSAADTFNWLLAPGITVQNRSMLATHWTLIPENDITPRPASFTLLGPNQEPVPLEAMAAAARSRFSELLGEQPVAPGRGTQRIVFTTQDLLVRDDATGAIHSIVKALAEINYEITNELVPFDLKMYKDSTTGELIT